MKKKIEIDRKFENNKRGVYGIFIILCNESSDEFCAYIGKSEQLLQRAKQHEGCLLCKTHISLLNNAMDDDKLRIEIRLIEAVEYKFDNYYKDAQRLASCENYWLDEKQKMNQCLEQLPEGRRPSIDSWKKLKNQRDYG